MVAWHGFRQNGQAFAKMGELLPAGYTLYAPDLPFHGETAWQEAEYGVNDLWAIVEQLTDEEEEAKVILAGFSLGGYLAGGMAVARPEATQGLLLLAPDTRLTTWGWLTHRVPHAWRVRLQRWLDKPGRLLQLADRLYRYSMLDRFALAFLHRTVADRSRRWQLFGTWRSRVHFPFSFSALRQLDCPLQVVLGRDDPLIPVAKLQKRLGKYARVVLVGSGHDLLPVAGQWIEEVINEG